MQTLNSLFHFVLTEILVKTMGQILKVHYVNSLAINWAVSLKRLIHFWKLNFFLCQTGWKQVFLYYLGPRQHLTFICQKFFDEGAGTDIYFGLLNNSAVNLSFWALRPLSLDAMFSFRKHFDRFSFIYIPGEQELARLFVQRTLAPTPIEKNKFSEHFWKKWSFFCHGKSGHKAKF